MKIVHIFGPDSNPDEGLWALEQKDGQLNEFDAIFDLWEDAEEIYKFCLEHYDDIKNKFGEHVSAEDAANELMDEADALLDYLYNLGKNEDGANLQQVFQPLDDREKSLTVLQPSKGKIKNKFYKDPKLRIYAVRITENTYVVTGGAIKLTNQMKDRDHTKEQYERLKKVKSWLHGQGICFPEDLKELI